MKYKSTSAVSESRPIWTVPSGATYGVRISLFLKLSLALLALCGGMVFALGGQVTEAGKWDEAIRRVIDQQQRAWNEGSIERFMDHYLNSDDLTFSSGGKTTRGWTATRDRYLARYPDRSAMGTVTFTEIEPFSLGDDAAFVLGRWKLDRSSEPIAGNFTLVFRKTEEGWKIIHDHTSSDPKE
ncbi:MAG: YybH family protein [Pirellulaceae bacterium]|jgi:ketosteroid isomerase-like protein